VVKKITFVFFVKPLCTLWLDFFTQRRNVENAKGKMGYYGNKGVRLCFLLLLKGTRKISGHEFYKICKVYLMFILLSINFCFPSLHYSEYSEYIFLRKVTKL